MSEDLTIRDRMYESFGQQGFAMPTYLSEPHERDGSPLTVGIAWDEAEESALAEGYVDRMSASSIGSHTERDERIHDAVLDRLTGDGSIDMSEVEIILHEGEVTLSGSVPTAVDRARAEILTERVLGVVGVVNRLSVVPHF